MMQILGGWECFAILGFLKFAKNHGHRVIAENFGFTEEETDYYIGKLLSVGLVEKTKSKYIPVEDFVWSPDGIPSEVIRKSHDKLLDKAKTALVNQTVDERDFTSMMFDIDKNDISKAKEDIRKFIKGFYSKYSEKKSATDVYSLNVQFFNLTPKERNRK